MALPSHRAPRPLAIAIAGVIALAATGCAPEPAPTASPSASPSATPSATKPVASPTATDEPVTGFAVPADCLEINSPAMRAQLESSGPPLNDPGVTLLSTENAALLEILDSASVTLRCTWGAPSEFGLATTVTETGQSQNDAVHAELEASGFGCEPLAQGTVCRIEEKGVTLDDQEYTRGETHFVGPGGWVSTAWLNFAPEGYTEDIVATLWG